MGHKEREIMADRLSNLPENKKLFRINSGMGWTGKLVRRDKNIVILQNPRPLHGAPPGWPDLCGWTSIEVTPNMVGQKIAVFTGEEIKAGKDRLRKDQLKFERVITEMGGIYRVILDAGK